jgi:hypothetical protein
MNAKLTAEVWSRDFDSSEHLILLGIAFLIEEGQEPPYEIGISRLAWLVGHSPRQIQRILARLCADGILTASRRSFGRGIKNSYFVNVEKASPKLPYEEVRKYRAASDPPQAFIPASLRKEVFERGTYRCLACGSWKDLQIDHIHAQSKGGPTEFDNLQTLCGPCNTLKGDACIDYRPITSDLATETIQ